MAEAAPMRAEQQGVWSEEEHGRFLEAMQFYPQGPWKCVAEFIGTRSVRQVQTHAQKYHEKIARRLRGLRKDRKKLMRQEHRIDDKMMEICQQYDVESVKGANIAPPPVLWGGYTEQQQQLQQQAYLRQRGDRNAAASAMETTDTSFHDYREYGYIDYIEEEFAFREADPNWVEEEEEDAAAATRSDLPSFSDCLDYLIDFFGNKDVLPGAISRPMRRMR